MGLKKIEIKPRKCGYDKISTYDKRKQGLVNKARELSIICDVPLLLLFSSPRENGPFQIVLGHQCSLEEMIWRLAIVPPQERNQRKLETLELIKKQYKDESTVVDIDVDSLMGSVEVLESHLSQVQAEIHNIETALIGPLRFVDDINNITDMKMLEDMEKALQAALQF